MWKVNPCLARRVIDHYIDMARRTTKAFGDPIGMHGFFLNLKTLEHIPVEENAY